MMKDKVRFGILGCGMIAEYHARAVISLADAKLVGVADSNSQKAISFAEKHGIRAYADYEEMLSDPEIDAVCICTPSGMHAKNSLDALAAKKHVVVEKPMALNTEDADKMIKACRESGCLLTVICQLRFSEGVKKLKALLEENAFGTLGLCDLYMKYWRSPQYYSGSTWRGTREMDGGALMNQGIHGVDMLLYLLGDAKLLSAKVKTRYHDIEAEDTAIAMLEFGNGALGVIESSSCSYPGFDRRLEICGSNGAAVLRENEIESLVIGDMVMEKNENKDTQKTASDPMAMSFLLHAKQIENFVNAILGKEELLIDGNEGRRAVALIEKIHEESERAKND